MVVERILPTSEISCPSVKINKTQKTLFWLLLPLWWHHLHTLSMIPLICEVKSSVFEQQRCHVLRSAAAPLMRKSTTHATHCLVQLRVLLLWFALFVCYFFSFPFKVIGTSGLCRCCLTKLLLSIYFCIDRTPLCWMGRSKVSTTRVSVQATPFYIFEQKSVCIYFCKPTIFCFCFCFSFWRSSVGLHDCGRLSSCDFIRPLCD